MEECIDPSNLVFVLEKRLSASQIEDKETVMTDVMNNATKCDDLVINTSQTNMSDNCAVTVIEVEDAKLYKSFLSEEKNMPNCAEMVPLQSGDCCILKGRKSNLCVPHSTAEVIDPKGDEFPKTVVMVIPRGMKGIYKRPCGNEQNIVKNCQYNNLNSPHNATTGQFTPHSTTSRRISDSCCQTFISCSNNEQCTLTADQILEACLGLGPYSRASRCSCYKGQLCAYCRVQNICEDILCGTKQSEIEAENKFYNDLSTANESKNLIKTTSQCTINCKQGYNYSMESVNKYPTEYQKEVKKNIPNKPLSGHKPSNYELLMEKRKQLGSVRQKACVESVQKRVPARRGWLWSENKEARKHGWFPGAVRKPVKKIINYFFQDYNRKQNKCPMILVKRTVTQPSKSPSCMQICRKSQGTQWQKKDLTVKKQWPPSISPYLREVACGCDLRGTPKCRNGLKVTDEPKKKSKSNGKFIPVKLTKRLQKINDVTAAKGKAKI